MDERIRPILTMTKKGYIQRQASLYLLTRNVSEVREREDRRTRLFDLVDVIDLRWFDLKDPNRNTPQYETESLEHCSFNKYHHWKIILYLNRVKYIHIYHAESYEVLPYNSLNQKPVISMEKFLPQRWYDPRDGANVIPSSVLLWMNNSIDLSSLQYLSNILCIDGS